MPLPAGYCTNVHAGATLAQARANLERHALAVRQRVAPGRDVGVGLWLSASAARELRGTPGMLAEWRDWLASSGLVPFTFNGFPHGDFHGEVVRHRVYHPTWWRPERLHYTLDLIDVIDALLPEGMPGSISTLPVAWGVPRPTRAEFDAAGHHLLAVAERLRRLEAERGRRVVLSIEPEPGCAIQRSGDLVDFLARHVYSAAEHEDTARRYLGACHDVCHAEVMFETQADAIARYAEAGVPVGKVQVSSAVRLPASLAGEGRDEAFRQLAAFAEPRYLHQTSVRGEDGSVTEFGDLPEALAGGRRDGSEWRVHFHVPIYLVRFGQLSATQSAVRECLAALVRHRIQTDFEVETYAWTVLPESYQVPELAEGIARELQWFEAARAEFPVALGE